MSYSESTNCIIEPIAHGGLDGDAERGSTGLCAALRCDNTRRPARAIRRHLATTDLVLVLVSPQERDDGARCQSQLQARRGEFEREETTVVVTTDAVPKLPTPAVLVADRWGEILYLETSSGDQTFRFPDVNELLSWMHFIAIQCPEYPP
jgi:hypothetical protein